MRQLLAVYLRYLPAKNVRADYLIYRSNLFFENSDQPPNRFMRPEAASVLAGLWGTFAFVFSAIKESNKGVHASTER